MKKILEFRFGIRGMMILIAGCAFAFWAVSDLIPTWQDYQRLKALARPTGHGESVIALDSVVVNLTDPGARRYLRIECALEMDDSDAIAVSSVVVDRNAEVRAWLVKHLSDKHSRDVVGKEGINAVGEEIQEGINVIIGAPLISRVLVTECNIQ